MMSDLMFYGVLEMPYEMAMENVLARTQFYSRVQEAVERLKKAEAQLEQVQGWVSVDAEQKPTGRKPILVAVSCIKFGEYEDGTPGEGHSRVVTEGEYIHKHGDSGDYFTAYASPMADQEWITHWRELPPPPEAA